MKTRTIIILVFNKHHKVDSIFIIDRGAMGSIFPGGETQVKIELVLSGDLE
jgi:hypothetical protein